MLGHAIIYGQVKGHQIRWFRSEIVFGGEFGEWEIALEDNFGNGQTGVFYGVEGRCKEL